MKVVIHQGFHKTGTTTLQRTLFGNRKLLKNRVNILLPQDLQDASLAARRYSIAPKDRTLQNFAARLRGALGSFESEKEKPLLISNEEFSGLIPGRKGVWSYSQTHVLAKALLDEIVGFTGDHSRIVFLYTTRNADDWIRSAYWQNLRSNRIRESLSEYSKALRQGADLEAVVSRVKKEISSRAEIYSINVSETDDRYLPLIKALSILNVRSDNLTPIDDQNVQPSGSAELFLEWNRSTMTDGEVAAAKRAHLDQWKRSNNKVSN
ncbi:hypothetical protein [Ruegeria sp. Ofav3-42]|uniref:hypothetical protein n=1 Tax=Ruegeria sp. Ofav3-42 TaxID=2917759 RepID=UPI001EF675F9|nr:hypothetical protein [Ruegeria sp. Ofav3-42]MCG7521804.1 hypothetical protein [Ruegeria sp. Ofav3-42]